MVKSEVRGQPAPKILSRSMIRLIPTSLSETSRAR
jgi:hypothetical protein